MFTPSKMIHNAMDFYISKNHRKKRNKIVVFGKKKNRYYCGDRESYRNEYLKSHHWRSLREEKLKLNPLCEQCGSNKRVEPHHIRYKNLYDVELTDLQTLCRKCHNKVHNPPIKKKRGKRYKVRNIFRHKTRLINKVSRMANVDKSVVESYIRKLTKNS